jgi:hypothetical protein
MLAGRATGLGGKRIALLFGFAGVNLCLGFQFLRRRDSKWSKAVENGSGLWTLVMYLWLGLGPYVFG